MHSAYSALYKPIEYNTITNTQGLNKLLFLAENPFKSLLNLKIKKFISYFHNPSLIKYNLLFMYKVKLIDNEMTSDNLDKI